MLVEIPGGTAELRERPSVPGRSLIAAYMADMRRCIAADADRVGTDVDAEMTEAVEIAEDDSPEAEAARDEQNRRFAERASPETYMAMDRVSDAAVVAMLKSWTLKVPVPKTMEALGALDDERAEAAVYKLRELLWPRVTELLKLPDFTVDGGYEHVNGRPVLVHDSPTLASSASNGHGSDTREEATSTTRRSTASRSTGSAKSSPEPPTTTS